MAIFSEVENLPKWPAQLKSGFSAYSPRVGKDAQLTGTIECQVWCFLHQGQQGRPYTARENRAKSSK